MNRLKGVAIGAGYCSQFHLDAWSRLDDVELTAICDSDRDKAELASAKHAVANCYSDVAEMLAAEKPDFADIITRPDSHISRTVSLIHNRSRHAVRAI